MVGCLFISTTTAFSQQSSGQLFEKALYTEEVKGELQNAIDLYQQIVKNNPENRQVTAKSLFQMGMCYEKLGNQEAKKAYQRIIQEFADQKDVVTEARIRLSRIEKPAYSERIDDMIVRKVLPDTDIDPLGTPSPDGRYISYTDWESGGNLAILDLKTGGRRCLTAYESEDEAVYYSSWSPDGKEIAYHWWNESVSRIYIFDLNDDKSRDLLNRKDVEWIELGNWSSDGKHILATLSFNGGPKCQIVKVSIENGSLEVLRTFEKTYTEGRPYYSPDSRFIAYNYPVKEDFENNNIFILSLEDNHEFALFEHPAHDYILGWTPDGKHLLFASDRTGTVDAMVLAVDQGKPVGQPELVKSNIGPIVPMGFTQNGSFFYGQWPQADNIYVTELDVEKGSILTPPEIIIERFEGKNYMPDYSSDGRYLAYVSNRGIITQGSAGSVLCIRDMESGNERIITPHDTMPYKVYFPQWSPNDRTIALSCFNRHGYAGIYYVDIQTGKFTPLMADEANRSDDMNCYHPYWSQDGKSVYYTQISRNNPTSRIIVHNIATGEQRVIFEYSSDKFIDRVFTTCISPDGKWLAAINRGKNRVLRIIPTEGGESQDLFSFTHPGGFPNSVIWSKDGKYIIFGSREPNEEEAIWNLMRISASGGNPMKIDLNIKGIYNLSLHPDGRHLTFSSAGYSFPKNHIWVMENFLSESMTKE